MFGFIPAIPLIGGGIPGPIIMFGPYIRFGKAYYLGYAEANRFSVTTRMSQIRPSYWFGGLAGRFSCTIDLFFMSGVLKGITLGGLLSSLI